MTHHDHDDPDRCITTERCRGMLELAIIVAIVALTITSPSLLMFPVLAAAAALLLVLAIWDDAACRRVDKRAAEARQRAGATRRGQDHVTGSGGDKRAASSVHAAVTPRARELPKPAQPDRRSRSGFNPF